MANGAAVPIGGNLNPQQGGVPTFPAQVAAAPVLPLATLARVQQQREQQEQQRPRQYASGTVYIPRQGTALQLPTPPYSTASSSSAVGFMAAPSQQQQQQYVVESSPEPAAAAVVYSLARTGGGQSPAAAAYEQVYSAADSGIKIRLSPTKYAKSRQRQQMTDQQQQIGAAAPSWPMMTPFKRHKH
jgi:hypothetical protein